jgi:adenine-specific DNA-methyltransferase
MNKSKKRVKPGLSVGKNRPRPKGEGLRQKVHKLKTQDAFKFLKTLEPSSADLIISSPPYCMGKEYDTSNSIDQFMKDHRKLAPLLSRALKPGGSLCWQVGHYVKDGAVIPLDALIYLIFRKQKELTLRNRIVWTFGHGLHATNRFSGRHETIMWFTKKGKKHKFDLNAVRVPQKYPGKKYYKGSKNGQWSGNPKGKNPTDVWDKGVSSQTLRDVTSSIVLYFRDLDWRWPEKGLMATPKRGAGRFGSAPKISDGPPTCFAFFRPLPWHRKRAATRNGGLRSTYDNRRSGTRPLGAGSRRAIARLGMHNHESGLWIPGSRSARPGMTAEKYPRLPPIRTRQFRCAVQ